MTKKPYRALPSTFDPVLKEVYMRVSAKGRFSMEYLSEREMMNDRLKLYRFRASMNAHEPDNTFTLFMNEVEIRHNLKTMVLELVYRPGCKGTMRYSLDKDEKGVYDPPKVDEVASLDREAWDAFIAKDRAKYMAEEEENEGKQGNSSE